MHTATIRLQLQCNLRCVFCNARSSHADAARFATAAVRRAIDAALDAGAEELILTGGEPTLHPDVAALVAYAGRRGARVVLETNAMALSLPGRAAQLAAATQPGGRAPVIRWGVAGLGATHDALGQRPGAFAAGLRGAQEAVKSGLELEVAFALSAPSRADLAALPGWLAASLPTATALLVRVVKEAPAGVAITPRAAALALRELAAACRDAGQTLRLDPRYALPLCSTRGGVQHPELFRVAAGAAAASLARIPACDACAIADLCAGVDRAWLAHAADFQPVGPRQRRRALGLASGRALREALHRPSEGLWSEEGGAAQLERVVRVNFHCNQDCAFCFVDRVLPAPSGEHVRAQIAQAARDGVALLSLSGGEPTLDPALPDHIRYGTELGLRMQIQTNATRAAKPAVAKALADAGLNEAFISLHGADAATSDAVTRAPGTFVQTLAGIDQLLDHGVRVSLNCVITGPNYQQLSALPRLVAERWGGLPTLNFSWANANSALVPIEEAVTPAFSRVRPHLAAALSACRDLDLDWRGLTGECGVPLCFLDPGWLDPRRVPELTQPCTADAADTADAKDTAGAAALAEPPTRAGPGFLKPPACDGCAVSARCVGVRREYAELHGLSEVTAITDRAAWLAAAGRDEPDRGKVE